MGDLAKHFARRVAQFEQECARLLRSLRHDEDVVFLGDSLVEHYRGRIRWVNRGIESDHLRWPEHNVFERLGSRRLHPDPLAIVTLVGINDVNDAPDDVERHADAYHHLLTNLRHLHARARLVVMSLLPTAGPSRHLNGAVRALNGRLADVASAHGATFWDLHARMFDGARGEARRGLLRDDGIHLDRTGYRVLSDFVQEHAGQLHAPHHRSSIARAVRRRLVPPVVRRAAELVAPSLPLLASATTPAIEVDRRAVAERLVQARGKEGWAHKADVGSDDQLLAAHVLPEVDFLCHHVARGAPLFGTLFLGSRASAYARDEQAWSAGGLRAALDKDRDAWLGALRDSGASAGQVAAFEHAFAALRARLPDGKVRRLRLLFIGDCLLEDVELLLAGRALEDGLLVDVSFVLSKNPLQQARAIAEKRSERFDGVVYSPLSWDFDPEFANFLEPAVRSPGQLQAELESIWSRVSSMIHRLADAFECPVYVHNTAAAVRASTEVRRAVKGLLSWPQREFARRELGRRIDALVSELNRKTFKHLVVIDELAAVAGLRDDLTIGRFLYNADAIHPASLSVEVANRLTHLVIASARLASKKVVVCDLDNTLWDGVIGEGLGVRHHLARQRVLQRLKAKGVVLAVCSKNDPANVRWDGGVLGAGDFVASEVSWAPKPVGLRKLQATLNLKLKDFVFIDDRSDERELVTQELPEVTVMDPCAEDTWRLFEAWAELLGEDEGDRTQLYRERAEREKVVGAEGVDLDPAAAAELFAKLDLSISIQRATEADLKRVHELINRTNQWNLNGARCTFNEVRAWHESRAHAIYTARVTDKFGDMGLICVCVVEFADGEARVSVFVLSCRVFGFGVETLVLEQVQDEAAARFGAPRVRGRFTPTAHNKPCADMYRAHGFVADGDAWVFPGGPVLAPRPTWFSRR